MRLFQSQMTMDDFEPPPPFLKDPTRDNLKHITQFRDGKHRVATPEKFAIMELSTSFEKRRLGKQQQILTEMSQRCREQEVADLSSKLSNKCVLESTEKNGKGRELTYYSTNFMPHKHKQSSDDSDSGRRTNSPSSTPLPAFEKTYKHFPARKIIKQQVKFDFSAKTNNRYSPFKTPRIDPSPVKALVSQALSEPYKRVRLVQSQRINGPIQLDHYIAPRQDTLAPLVLPTIDNAVQDKLDAFSTSRVHLGARSKVNTAGDSLHDATLSTKSSIRPNKSVYSEHVMSNINKVKQGGHSPPPNSAEPPMELEAH